MQKFGDGGQMAGEIALGPLRHTLSTPCDEHILGQAGVRVQHLDVGELDFALGELVNQIEELTLFTPLVSSILSRRRGTHHHWSEP